LEAGQASSLKAVVFILPIIAARATRKRKPPRNQKRLPTLQKTPLLRILREDGASEGLHVHIGEEHGVEDIRDCTLITKTYRIGEKSIGTLGVMGPTRLDYSRAIAVVDSVASKLSNLSETIGF